MKKKGKDKLRNLYFYYTGLMWQLDLYIYIYW